MRPQPLGRRVGGQKLPRSKTFQESKMRFRKTKVRTDDHNIACVVRGSNAFGDADDCRVTANAWPWIRVRGLGHAVVRLFKDLK